MPISLPLYIRRMDADQLRGLQRDLNYFTDTYKLGLEPLIVDGQPGPATRRRLKEVKWHLGLLKERRNFKVTGPFLWRLHHPRYVRKGKRRRHDEALVKRGKQRRRDRRRWVARNQVRGASTKGVGTYDSKPVPRWMIPYLDYARENGWQGVLVSGWRDPAYSEQLCMAMCGAPRCPGKCAGRASNHSGQAKPRGAIDVSDYERFGQLMRQCSLQPALINRLGPQDPVHFSATGN